MYVTVIIGASGEIGAAMVEAARARGGTGTAFDLTPPTHAGCACLGSSDIAGLHSVRHALSDAMQIHGRINNVFNAAGIMSKGSLRDSSGETFSRMLDINLGGAFRLTQAAADLMGEAGGAIVHTPPIHASRRAQDRSLYAAFKAGMNALVQSAASELGSRSITINAVASGRVGRGMGSEQRRLNAIPETRAAGPESSGQRGGRCGDVPDVIGRMLDHRAHLAC